MAYPCFCGCSLHLAVLLISIAEMIHTGMASITAAVIGSKAIREAIHEGTVDTREGEAAFRYIIFVISFLIPIGQFMLGATLFEGRNQKDKRYCRVWLIASIILLGVGLVSFVTLLGFGVITATGYPGISNIVSSIIGCVYRIFTILIVYEYIKELGHPDSALLTNNNGHPDQNRA